MTPAEIVKALRFCKFGEPCSRCPVENNKNCINVMHERAADLIERLEKEKAALLESLKASVGNCTLCKHGKSLLDCDGFCLDCGSVSTCSCGTCDKDSKWEWKGLVENK